MKLFKIFLLFSLFFPVLLFTGCNENPMEVNYIGSQSKVATSEETPPLGSEYDTLECGTAYAFGNIEFCGLPGLKSNNWGWTREIAANPYYEGYIPIYWGAAHCDPNNGTQIGVLSIDYADGVINLDYTIYEPNKYLVNSVHIWISEETLLPLDKKGRYTAAPGKFNYNNPTFPFSTSDYEDTFYLAVHFDLCRDLTQ